MKLRLHMLVFATLAFSAVAFGFAPPGPVTVDSPFQIKYASNLANGDAVFNITNTGASATSAQGQPVPFAQFNINGSICVNIYAFAADEQEVSCCSCLVTPNGLYSLSARNALLNSILTPSVPNELVVKLIATTPTSSTSTATGLITQTCNPATIGTTSVNVGLNNHPGDLQYGLLAWGTTVHAAPTSPVSYKVTETAFLPGALSVTELQRDVVECQFIQILGSGQFGICKGCQNVGLGAAAQ